MLKNIFLTLLLVVSLQAKNGLNQAHLVSVSPQLNAQEVVADTSIEVEYDLPISKHSLHHKTITLKSSHGKNIAGTINIKNENILVFTPKQELTSGEYEVKVKSLTLQDYTTHTKFKSSAKKMCSFFYDDVKECKLYTYACRVNTKQIKYSFNVDDNQPKVVSLTLNKSNIELNEDNTTTISVNAKYDNNETMDVTNEVEWILSNSSIISIVKNVITPLREGTTTLQAKFNNQTTAEISLTVYREINGYKLPPEPDEALNNSTLLGIDVNNNGVRDDVERYVIKRFSKDPEFPKTKTALAMQYAWAEQKIIENPVIESSIYTDDALDCETYWLRKKVIGMTTLEGLHYFKKHEVFSDTAIKDKIYNTRKRIERNFEFNQACSGNIFDGRKAKLDYCHTNIDSLGE